MTYTCSKFVLMSVKRKTKSLGRMLSIFNKTSEALSAVDLVEQLKDEMNKTTVYRILERLESEGIIHSFLGTNGLQWYAKCYRCTSHEHNDIHPHFECENCGKVECLEVQITIPVLNNRQVKSADILLKGRCADCMT